VRVVGIDLGTRRVGVAVSDDQGRLATAHAVLERTGDDGGDRRTLASVVSALGAGEVVVGLPLSLDGTPGPAARWAVCSGCGRDLHHARVAGRCRFCGQGAAGGACGTYAAAVDLLDPACTVCGGRPRVLDLPLHLHDERLSTVTASRRPGSVGTGRRRPTTARQRKPVDATAAAVMLQSWLDARTESL